MPRTLFVSKKVWEAVHEPFPDGKEVLHSEFRQTLDGFLEGGEMSVGEDPYTKASDALMARVGPVEDEFFDFRVTAPYPQIRTLGGFAEKDTFVLLTWQYRDVIADDFNGEVELCCKDELQRLFGQTQPHKGKTLDDYLSNWIAV